LQNKLSSADPFDMMVMDTSFGFPSHRVRCAMLNHLEMADHAQRVYFWIVANCHRERRSCSSNASEAISSTEKEIASPLSQ
jgi:hypothetical protein